MSEADTTVADTPAPVAAQPDKLQGVVLAVNVLYALSILVGVTGIVGVVIAYMKRDSAAGTPWESHFIYAIRTFWLGFLMVVVGLALMAVGIGFVILAFTAIWYIIRVVRGFLAWNDGVAIANPKRFF